MIVIGLTGSIGMGKSTTARILEDMGVPFHDADAAVHRLMAPGGAAVNAVGKAFPQALEHSDPPNAPFINRQKLGQVVLKDPERMKELEDILHPLVRADSDRFLQKCRERGLEFAVLDIPLLFETGGEKRVDVTMCVTAPFETQRARVLARPNMTKEKFQDILSRQMPDAEKRKRADIVITTDVSVEDTRGQLVHALDEIRKGPEKKGNHKPG